MLKEIHLWFVENLRDVPTMAQTQTMVREQDNRIQNQHKESALDGLYFQLYAESEQMSNLICKRAGLHAKWKDALKGSATTQGKSTAQNHLFVCQCSSQFTDTEAHQLKTASFGRKSAQPSCKLACYDNNGSRVPINTATNGAYQPQYHHLASLYEWLVKKCHGCYTKQQMRLATGSFR